MVSVEKCASKIIKQERSNRYSYFFPNSVKSLYYPATAFRLTIVLLWNVWLWTSKDTAIECLKNIFCFKF